VAPDAWLNAYRGARPAERFEPRCVVSPVNSPHVGRHHSGGSVHVVAQVRRQQRPREPR